MVSSEHFVPFCGKMVSDGQQTCHLAPDCQEKSVSDGHWRFVRVYSHENPLKLVSDGHRLFRRAILHESSLYTFM